MQGPGLPTGPRQREEHRGAADKAASVVPAGVRAPAHAARHGDAVPEGRGVGA